MTGQKITVCYFKKELTYRPKILRGFESALRSRSRLMDFMIPRTLYVLGVKTRTFHQLRLYFFACSNSVHPLIWLTQDVHICFVLHRMGLPVWVHSFISNRRCRVVRPSTTDYVDFGIGVSKAQGWVLSCSYCSFQNCSHLLHCAHAEYADDVTLWHSHPYPHHQGNIKWRPPNNRDLGPAHETALLQQAWTFHFSLNTEQVEGLQFHSTNLTKAEKLVLLGVHFDHALMFKRHVATRKANMLRCLRAAKLSKNAEALLVLYKGCIRPKIEHASEVATTHGSTPEKVEACFLRIILVASNSTPHVRLQSEASV